MRTGIVVVAVLVFAAPAVADDWPQYLGPKRDGVWRETGVLDSFPPGGPAVLWKKPVGAGFSGPAVAAGRVYLTDFHTGDGQKAAQTGPGHPSVAGVERALCLDAKDGSQIWKHEYPCTYKNLQYASGPRATPTVDGDRVYTLGAMGDLVCLDAAKGQPLWKKNFLTDYNARLPIWGFAAAPLVDGDKLICLTGGDANRLVVAFDKKTGREIWTALTLTESDAGYSPPMIYDLAGKRTLVIWHSRAVVGLDPETGKEYWSQRFDVKVALTAPAPRPVGGDRLLVVAFYEGSMMLRIKPDGPPVVLWKDKGKGEMAERSDTLHSIIPTPVVKGGYIYGVCSYGELRCLNADTGERVWFTRKPTVGTPTEEGKAIRWGNAFLTEHADRFFLFNEKGELVIARLSPSGYEEIDRAKVIAPTNRMPGRPVVWVPPAFADRKMVVRNDAEVVCVSLAK
jgi:outer membrane protein assembly factor BamB